MMKLITFPLFFLPIFAFTQSYTPFIDQDSTSTWKDYHNHTNQPYQFWSQVTENVYHITGDTILGGQNYAKLSRKTRQFSSPTPGLSTGTAYTNHYYDYFAGAIREEAKQVYFWNPSDNQEHLIYDFNLVVGDTVPSPTHYYTAPVATIDSIDSVQIGGIYRKRYHLIDFNGSSADPGFGNVLLIEGIGSTSGMLQPFFFEVFESLDYLICYKEYGQSLISVNNLGGSTDCNTESLSTQQLEANDFQVFPNPVQSGSPLYLESNENYKNELRIISTEGKLIKSIRLENGKAKVELSLPSGLYFLSTHSGIQARPIVVY